MRNKYKQEFHREKKLQRSVEKWKDAQPPYKRKFKLQWYNLKVGEDIENGNPYPLLTAK